MLRIDGGRLSLKTLTRGEFHDFYKRYAPDPVMDPQPYVYDRDKVDRFFDICAEKESWYPRLGIFLMGGELVGELSIKRIDHEKSRCELGVAMVNDAFKGKGYGTEAVQLAIGYVFGTLGLKSIYADTMGSNGVMQHILEKLGFVLIGREERRYDMRGRWEDRLDYVLENPLYRKQSDKA